MYTYEELLTFSKESGFSASFMAPYGVEKQWADGLKGDKPFVIFAGRKVKESKEDGILPHYDVEAGYFDKNGNPISRDEYLKSRN